MKNCETNTVQWPQGNTMSVVFHPVVNGGRESLLDAANLNVTLSLAGNRHRPVAVTNPRIEDGAVKFTIRGEDQTQTGLHKLIVRYTKGEDLRTFGSCPFTITPVGTSGSPDSCCPDIEIPEMVLSAEIIIGGGGTSDHRELSNRDASDQHPIEAITGLSEVVQKVEDLEFLVGAANTALENRLNGE